MRENVWRNVGELSGMGVQTPMQSYKSLCIAIMISATLVNTHTHTLRFQPAILLAQPSQLKTTDKTV